jgi:acetyl esterase/lipase
MSVTFDEQDLAATREANRRLARMPRLRLHNPVQRALLQGLIRGAAPLMGKVAARQGVQATERIVKSKGRSVGVRVLLPTGPIKGLHVHIHGGGWTIGSARLDDALNAALAAEQGIAVVSVEYRLIPAVNIVACIDDCETAARWVLDNGLGEFEVERMTIGGESAGAHLAAATVLRLRDAGTRFDRLAGAALTYGCFDLGGTPMREHAGPETLVLHGPSLGRVLVKATGMNVSQRRAPALSPLHADLHGLPPALFVVGTCDPLQQDTELMHEKWAREAGNAELVIVPEAAHGFNHQANSTADKTNAYIRAWIGERLTNSAAI